jgi:Protein of unknown function (DUF3987)
MNPEQLYNIDNIEELVAGLSGSDKMTFATEDEPDAFPQEAFTGIFFRWLDQIRQVTDAPIEYLWGALLLGIGIIIGRGAWIANPRPLYPNFYVLFLGPSGSSRKSTVVYLVQHLLELLNIDYKTLQGIVSSEGVVEALSEHEEIKALGYADEFRTLLSVAGRKGTQDLIPKLQSLYYCTTTSIDRRKDPSTAIDPFFSIITASPAEYIEDLIGDREISGGFFNRFLTIVGQSRKAMPRPKKLRDVSWHHISKPLNELRGIRNREVDLDPEAGMLWDTWFEQWTNDHRNLPTRDQVLTERIPEHALKIALVYALTKNERAISAQSLATAIKICGWLQSSALRTFRDAGVDRIGKCERIIVETLKRTKDRRMWRRDLQRTMSARGYNAEMFNRTIRALEINDQIRPYPVTVASGKHRTAVELL